MQHSAGHPQGELTTLTAKQPGSYLAIRMTRPEWPFAIVSFFAEASEMRTWTGVYRKAWSLEGYQRMLNTKHAKAIAQFFEADAKNVIPNSVVVAFAAAIPINGTSVSSVAFVPQVRLVRPGEGSEPGALTLEAGELTVNIHPECMKQLPDEQPDTREERLAPYRSAFVIDGQHRLEGGNIATMPVYLPVTAFVGLSAEEQAFHFIVINGKAKKVSKTDIDAVIPKEIYQTLQQRLLSANMPGAKADIVWALDHAPDSPFRGLIDWPNNKTGQHLFSKGGIDRVVDEAEAVPDHVKDLFEDNTSSLLMAIWAGIRAHLEPLWTSDSYAPEPGETFDNQLVEKAGAVLPALQKVINQALVTGAIIIDSEIEKDPEKNLPKAVQKYIKRLPLSIFYCRWKVKSITNDVRIGELKDQLLMAISTGKVNYDKSDWFDKPESREAAAALRTAARIQKLKSKKKRRKRN